MKKLPMVIVLLLICLQSVCYGEQWPEITPISGEITFDNPETAAIQIEIKNAQHETFYILTCRSGDLEDINNFNYSGIFQCRLASCYSKDYDVTSLLVEDLPQTADWEGRARFLLDHVVGKCADTPDWGARQTFLLRKMRIVLNVNNVSLTGAIKYPILNSFRFAYTISPDNSAISSIAAKSQISEPDWFATGGTCLMEVLKNK
jgi:hypothetical protein